MNTVSLVSELIGNTPLFSFKHPLVPENKNLYLKLEQFNPNFSIKDRTALGLIERAFATGKLQIGGMVIESSSGNLGKSLAMLSASMKFKLIVVVDPKVTKSALNWLKAFGANVEMVDTVDEFGGYQSARIARVKALLEKYPNAYWTNQYDNPDNANYHESVTAKEFFNLPIDIIVGSVSTGGHFSGISKGLRAHCPSIKSLACDVVGSAIFGTPFQPYLLNGLGLSFRAKNTDMGTFDYLNLVSDQNAISLCRVIAKDSGLLLGGSSGVVIFSALLALQVTSIKSALAITADSGINYLEQIYDDEWLAEKQVKLLTQDKLQQQLLMNKNSLTFNVALSHA